MWFQIKKNGKKLALGHFKNWALSKKMVNCPFFSAHLPHRPTFQRYFLCQNDDTDGVFFKEMDKNWQWNEGFLTPYLTHNISGIDSVVPKIISSKHHYNVGMGRGWGRVERSGKKHKSWNICQNSPLPQTHTHTQTISAEWFWWLFSHRTTAIKQCSFF